MITGYSDSLHTQHQEASLKILVELLNVLRVPGCTYMMKRKLIILVVQYCMKTKVKLASLQKELSYIFISP